MSGNNSKTKSIEPKGIKKKLDAKTSPPLIERARTLGLWGLVENWSECGKKEWIADLLDLEERERHRRSLERRLHNARIGHFVPMADFDWNWPKKIDREQVEDVMRLSFFSDGANVVLLGGHGLGKTMIARNIAYQSVISGRTVRVVTASELLCDLGSQETTTTLMRRLRRYTSPALLVIDEIGYLSATSKHADLLFEVVTRRYNERRPIIVTTNKGPKEWGEVFPNAACVVAMVDRLFHRCEIIKIDGDSRRNHESQERSRTKQRPTRAASSGQTG